MVTDNILPVPHYQGKFLLYRGKLSTDAQGHTLVAEGCIFTNGKVAVCWLSEHSSIAAWDSFDDFLAVSFAQPPSGRWATVEFLDMLDGGTLYKETP